MDVSTIWRQFFQNWPQGVPRSGVVVTTFGDQIAFVSYLSSNDLVILERRAPDAVGGRKVVLPYEKIDAVKFVDSIPSSTLEAAGFASGPQAKPKSA